MSDREYFTNRAQAEREAAREAEDGSAFHAHMALAREYEWRAATEPYPESTPAKPRLTAEPRSAPA